MHVKAIAVVSLMLAVACLCGCAADQVARNIYEGGRAYQESLKTTPLGTARGEAKGYDEYEAERQRVMREGKK